MKSLLYILLLVVVLSSCKTQNIMEEHKEDVRYQHVYSDSVFMYKPNYEYRIRKDDKITMSIWDHDDLSIGSLYGIYNSNEVYGKWVLVDAHGQVTLPRIGNFTIGGMTVIEAKDSLAKLYGKWIVNPIIEVKVINKEINVLGEVKTPGKFVVDKDNNTIFDIVARAGDFDFYANKKCVKIIRQDGATVKMINVDLTHADNYLNRNIQVLPGDMVIVPSKKNKEFDKRISTIIPIVSSISALALMLGLVL
jgi:polysaccharide export outer membrane protein